MIFPFDMARMIEFQHPDVVIDIIYSITCGSNCAFPVCHHNITTVGGSSYFSWIVAVFIADNAVPFDIRSLCKQMHRKVKQEEQTNKDGCFHRITRSSGYTRTR